jgi:hypothetical protein
VSERKGEERGKGGEAEGGWGETEGGRGGDAWVRGRKRKKGRARGAGAE